MKFEMNGEPFPNEAVSVPVGLTASARDWEALAAPPVAEKTTPPTRATVAQMLMPLVFHVLTDINIGSSLVLVSLLFISRAG